MQLYNLNTRRIRMTGEEEKIKQTKSRIENILSKLESDSASEIASTSQRKSKSTEELEDEAKLIKGL
jgi:hypothetical protein